MALKRFIKLKNKIVNLDLVEYCEKSPDGKGIAIHLSSGFVVYAFFEDHDFRDLEGFIEFLKDKKGEAID